MEENIKKHDILKIYFGDEIKVDDFITIHQPTIGEILDYGEFEFWGLANQLCGNTTSMRLPLWEAGIDWCEISDYELFISFATSLPLEKTQIFFGDLDFTKFRGIQKEDKIILINEDNPEIQIDEDTYNVIVGYLRIICNIYPKVEKAKGKFTKESIIEEERMNQEIEAKKHAKDKWQPSLLFPLISAALNHPGFKYKKKELKEVGIVEFMDSIKRLQIYESTISLMSGMYSGMLDTSKINLDKELNWTRDLYND